MSNTWSLYLHITCRVFTINVHFYLTFDYFIFAFFSISHSNLSRPRYKADFDIRQIFSWHQNLRYIKGLLYCCGYKGKAKFLRPSRIFGPKTQCSLHFKFGKHLQLFRQYDKVLKKYNQSCPPPGGCNRGYYGILEY